MKYAIEYELCAQKVETFLCLNTFQIIFNLMRCAKTEMQKKIIKLSCYG